MRHREKKTFLYRNLLVKNLLKDGVKSTLKNVSNRQFCICTASLNINNAVTVAAANVFFANNIDYIII